MWSLSKATPAPKNSRKVSSKQSNTQSPAIIESMFPCLPDRLVAMGVTLVQWPVCGSYRSTEFRMFRPSYPPVRKHQGNDHFRHGMIIQLVNWWLIIRNDQKSVNTWNHFASKNVKQSLIPDSNLFEFSAFLCVVNWTSSDVVDLILISLTLHVLKTKH